MRIPVYQQGKYLAAIGLLLPVFAQAVEGYSSPSPGAPAKPHFRAFTLYVGRENCDTRPQAAELRLRLPGTEMEVGDRLHFINGDDQIVSEIIVEAYDANGNFIPEVPLYFGAQAEDATATYDPNVIQSYSHWDYWEAMNPGRFTFGVDVACDYAASNPVKDTETVTVADPSRFPVHEQVARHERMLARALIDRDVVAFERYLCDDAVSTGFTDPLRGRHVVAEAWNRLYYQSLAPPFQWIMAQVEMDSTDQATVHGVLQDDAGQRVATYATMWRNQGAGDWCLVSIDRR